MAFFGNYVSILKLVASKLLDPLPLTLLVHALDCTSFWIKLGTFMLASEIILEVDGAASCVIRCALV
jgi:hypothetical protein